MTNYKITIEPPENEKAPMYSAHCEKWGFVAEDETPEAALIGLLDAIRLAKMEEKKIPRNFKKPLTFQIPAFS